MKKYTHAGMASVFAVLLSVGLTSQALAYTQIQTQLDFGETNSDVTSLQMFFKDNSMIYPEGLVTGYFGGLTKSAVQRFQAAYNLDQVGRVGPMTRDRINTLISSGGWVTSDVSGPQIFSVTKTITTSNATFTWSTDEIASAKVFYSTNPVTMNEGDINSVGFGATNGMTAQNDGLSRTSQQVTLSNLQSNTKYYYTLVATDLKGNVSVFGPNHTFFTN